MKWVKLVLIMAIIAIGLLVMSVWHNSPKQPKVISARFLENGKLLIKGIESSAQLRLYGSQNSLVAVKQTLGKSALLLDFPWQPKSEYKIETDGEQESIVIRAPETKPEFAIRLHAPLGQAPHEFYLDRKCRRYAPIAIPFPIPENEVMDMMLEVESLSDQEELRLNLLSTWDNNNQPVTIPELSQKEVALTYEFEKKIWTTQIKSTNAPYKNRIKIVLNGTECRVQLDVHLVARKIDPESIEIGDWQVPTDDSGVFSSRHSVDRLTMPNRIWQRVAMWFGVPPKVFSFYDPYTYQAFTITNKSDQPISFLVKSEILDIVTGKPAHYFDTPKLDATGGTEQIIGFAKTQIGQSSRVVLPVFIKPDIKAGSFSRRIRIIPMGSDTPIKTIENKLHIEQSNSLYTLWLLLIVTISIGWLVAIVIVYRRLLSSLGVRLLVLLSLLGSLQFCLSFVSSIISGIFYAVLGPFNCLVGGLFSEVIMYLIITAILFLVPRVGAITVAGLVSYIIGGIMFGSFGLTDILFTGSSLAFKELFLFVFGITKLRSGHYQPPNIVLMMIALGLADAASTFTSLILHSVFYRLFFADWYFIMQVGITGFCYTALGVFLGNTVGKNLRKVHV